MGQIVELTRSDLCDPDVHVSVPVRQKRYEMTVAGDRSGLLQPIEVCDRLKSCVRDGVSPEVFRFLQPEAYPNRQHGHRRCQRQGQGPSATKDPYRRAGRWCGGLREGNVPIVLSCREIPAARPRVQLRPGGVDRAHPVMQVPVDGHPLPLLPALDRGHVAFEVGRNLLPGIQPVFLRIAVYGGMVRPSGSPGWSANVTNPGTKLYPCPARARQKTAFDGKPGKRLYLCTLPLEGARQMSDCFRASQANLKLEVFYEKQNPGFGGTRAFTALVGFSHLCFGPGAQASAPQRPDQRLFALDPTIKGSPWEMHGQWSMDVNPERGTADFSADMTMSGYGMTATGAIDPTKGGAGAHTHHITLTNVKITWDMTGCPTYATSSPKWAFS